VIRLMWTAIRPFCFVASLPLFVVNESYESIAVI
jgi:hypothetical protein